MVLLQDIYQPDQCDDDDDNDHHGVGGWHDDNDDDDIRTTKWRSKLRKIRRQLWLTPY